MQQQTLEIAQWREQAGLGTSLETSQARSAVEQTRAALPLLDAGAVQTAHALAVLTGEPPAALQSLLSTATALPQPPQDLTVAIPAQTLRQRPDVLAAEWQLRAAASRVAQADANRLPTFNLGASIAWASTTIGSLGSIAAARSLVASVGQTLFDHGQRNALLAAQQAAFDAAQETYRARVLAALQDVEDSLSALSASRDRVVALHAAADASRDAALLAGHRYTSGLIDFQTVIDTQRTLLNVRDSVVSAETDLATGHVRLYKALGGGWSPADVATRRTICERQRRCDRIPAGQRCHPALVAAAGAVGCRCGADRAGGWRVAVAEPADGGRAAALCDRAGDSRPAGGHRHGQRNPGADQQGRHRQRTVGHGGPGPGRLQ